MAGALHGGVDFLRAFPQKEQTATEQDEVLQRYFFDVMHDLRAAVRHEDGQRMRQVEQRRLVELQDPEDQAQHRDAQHHGTPDADAGGRPLLVPLQLAGRDGHEQQIVDAQYDFQEGQGGKAAPEGR